MNRPGSEWRSDHIYGACSTLDWCLYGVYLLPHGCAASDACLAPVPDFPNDEVSRGERWMLNTLDKAVLSEGIWMAYSAPLGREVREAVAGNIAFPSACVLRRCPQATIT